MTWTPQRVIGHNIKARREALGMTAAALGEKIGKVFGKGGKAWPRQTVSLMESGERSMVAAEVAALAQILDLRVADLFTPPAEAETVTAGTMAIPSEQLTAPIEGDADTVALSDDLRALDRTRAEILVAVRAQEELLGNARAALRGERPVKVDGDSAVERYMTATRAAANRYYEDKGPLRFGPMGEDDGEDQ